MTKYCAFCGAPPTDKNKEHVIPKWLIKLTGDPKRKVRLGFRFGSKSSDNFREFSFDQFTFPACEKCNLEHSKLEENAKDLMLRVLAADPLVPSEISVLLDWFDKVRVGLWLGFHQLNKNFFEVDPNFHISHRISQFDRVLTIQVSDFTASRLSFGGTDTPAFSYVPSAFTLIVNNFYFTSISSAFLLARRLGFPYPKNMYLVPDRPEILCDLLPGRNRIMQPVLQYSLPSGSLAVYQPMYGEKLASTPSPLYESPYVRKHSIQQLAGAGSIFVGTQDEAARPLDVNETCILSPKATHIDRRIFIQSAIDICKWQNWLNDDTLNLDRLMPHQKKMVRIKQRFARRFNNMLTEHHQRILHEEFP